MLFEVFIEDFGKIHAVRLSILVVFVGCKLNWSQLKMITW